MFKAKRYAVVTREERFFCALFGHALLMSPIVRQRFSALVGTRWAANLDPNALEVYLEPATLRDYWHDLSTPIEQSTTDRHALQVAKKEIHEKRRAVVETILRLYQPTANLDTHNLFWTSHDHHALRSPARWKPEAIELAGLTQLRAIRQAFNAKPDMLIVSGETAILIEAKVESGEGVNTADDYQQFRIQRKIVDLLKALHPSFQRTQFTHLLLDIAGEGVTELGIGGLKWRDVRGLVDTSEVDAFSRDCLEQLRRYEREANVSVSRVRRNRLAVAPRAAVQEPC